MGQWFSGKASIGTVLTLSALTNLSQSVEHHVYISSVSGNTISCASATSDDTCFLHCDERGQKVDALQFDCGTTAFCTFNCEQKSCAQALTINATNVVNQFTVHSLVSECMDGTKVFLPDEGSAVFSTNAQYSFQNTIINAGRHTTDITMNCNYGYGECIGTQINAQTAQSLQIIISNNAIFHSGIINCPQNSNYDGPALVPCIIDISNGGQLQTAQINTLYGVPHDLWLKQSNGVIEQVNITCSEYGYTSTINSISEEDITTQQCYVTDAPTDHTIGTTLATQYPTGNPIKHPTAGPITAEHPTNRPANEPSFLIDITTIMPSESVPDTHDTTHTNEMLWIIIVAASSCVFVSIIVIICIYMKRSGSSRKAIQKLSTYDDGETATMDDVGHETRPLGGIELVNDVSDDEEFVVAGGRVDVWAPKGNVIDTDDVFPGEEDRSRVPTEGEVITIGDEDQPLDEIEIVDDLSDKDEFVINSGSIDVFTPKGNHVKTGAVFPGEKDRCRAPTQGAPLAAEGMVHALNRKGANEVKAWLKSINLSMYYDKFIQHGFDSMDLVKVIDDKNDLKDVVELTAHRLKLFHYIQQMQK
eukprot:938123_1